MLGLNCFYNIKRNATTKNEVCNKFHPILLFHYPKLFKILVVLSIIVLSTNISNFFASFFKNYIFQWLKKNSQEEHIHIYYTYDSCSTNLAKKIFFERKKVQWFQS